MAILMYNITFSGRCKICHSITNLCTILGCKKKKNTARAWEWWKWRSLPVKDWFWLADSPGADLFSTVIDILVLNSGIKHLGITDILGLDILGMIHRNIDFPLYNLSIILLFKQQQHYFFGTQQITHRRLSLSINYKKICLVYIPKLLRQLKDEAMHVTTSSWVAKECTPAYQLQWHPWWLT